MHILLIRHGEPDYKIDSLTEKGWREADMLAVRLSKMDITEFFVSPLGRARDTASRTLEKMNRTAIEYEWLKEFPIRMRKPYGPDRESVVWDWLPEIWSERDGFYSSDQWYEEPEFEAAGVREEYERVTSEFDHLLGEHGYVRDGRIYRAVRSNRDTLVFFCHFGISCMLLGHLLNISPMLLLHGTVMAPTAVTSLYTEERREGIVQFRANMIGDTSHLYAAGEEPSFAARFCETFDNPDERH